MANQSPALDDVFHALANPARQVIVERLARGTATVSEIAKPLSMALPTVLQHLKVLEDSGLVRSEKVGRVRTCELRPAALDPAESWLGEQRALWEARFDRLETYLDALQAEEPDP